MATTIVIKHYGKVVNGIKHYYNPELQKLNLKELEGQEFEEVICKKTRKMSDGQRNYYWGGIIKTAMTTEMFGGWYKEEIHEFFTKLFLSYKDEEKVIVNGKTQVKIIDKVRDIKLLSSKEMSEYCNHVITWLAKHSIVVLDADKYKLTKF